MLTWVQMHLDPDKFMDVISFELVGKYMMATSWDYAPRLNGIVVYYPLCSVLMVLLADL